MTRLPVAPKAWSPAANEARTRGWPALLALLLVPLAVSMLWAGGGCGPNSHFSLIRSVGDGNLTIDRYHWQTCDKAYYHGHFFSVKAPGLDFIAFPVYAGLHAVGLEREHPPSVASIDAVNDDLRPQLWPLTLWAVLLPLALMLLLVRRLADRIEPGFGVMAALTVGLASLALPFASSLFSHDLSALLGVAAFAILWAERRGPPSPKLLLAAGAVAGYGVFTEYPLAIVGGILGLYVLSRPGQRALRGLVYAGGVIAALVPLAVYNLLAFGSVGHLSYGQAVIDQGQSGHDNVGSQAAGFYGVTVPHLRTLLDLLVGAKGLLVVTPVFALAAVGLVLMWRRGLRAEALVIAGIGVVMVVYDAAYYLPLGGDVPGPRLLIPTLPFLALPLAITWRRLPLTSVALGAVSAASMLGATATTASWGQTTILGPELRSAVHGRFKETLLSPLGVGTAWLAIVPVAAAVVAACVLCARATPWRRPTARDVETAVAALAAWLLVVHAVPAELGLGSVAGELAAVAIAAAAVATAILVARRGPGALVPAAPLLLLFLAGVLDQPAVVLLLCGAVAAGEVLLVLSRRSRVPRSAWAVLALVAIAASYAVLLRPTGCGPNSHFGLVRALDRGELTIDRYQWQACDKSYFHDHFYSNKGPGLAFVALPVYAALHGLGLTGEHLPSIESAAANGDNIRAAVWPLTLWSVVFPALLIMLLVRRFGDELEPGYGAAAAATLGLCTLLIPFGSLFIQHLLSGALALTAFALAARERAGRPSLLLLTAAAALAAYASSVEYPLALVAVLIGLYALIGRPGPVRRAGALAAGAAVGLAPLLLYNQLAFGSVRHLSYANQVSAQGQTGHDRIGAQSRGLYGVTSPRLHQGLDLLFGHRGLFALAPVVALALVGLVVLYRRGRRAEALLAAGVALGIWGYNTGFPRGGDVPGPRYLIPALPFLFPTLAIAWKRLPVTTGALALVSAISMVVATVTGGSWNGSAVWPWFVAIGHGDLTQTVLTLVGVGHGWLALTPFVAVLVLALVALVQATPRPAVRRRDAELALAALSGWLLLSGVGPALLARYGFSVDLAIVLLVATVACALWGTARSGLPALAAASPLLVLLAPSLAKSPGAVVIASAAALLLLSALLALPRRRPPAGA